MSEDTTIVILGTLIPNSNVSYEYRIGDIQASENLFDGIYPPEDYPQFINSKVFYTYDEAHAEASRICYIEGSEYGIEDCIIGRVFGNAPDIKEEVKNMVINIRFTVDEDSIPDVPNKKWFMSLFTTGMLHEAFDKSNIKLSNVVININETEVLV